MCLPRHSRSHISNGDADIIELEKSRNLSKQQGKTSTPHEFAPGWNEHLASVSEAYVKVLSTLAFVELIVQLTTFSGGQSDRCLTRPSNKSSYLVRSLERHHDTARRRSIT